MVIIRLSRGGSNKRPFYHFQATDSRNKRDGRYLEKLGYFNPIARGGEVRININLERVEYWQSVGAQLSARVAFLLKEYKKASKVNAVETSPTAKKTTEKAKAKKKTETSGENKSAAETSSSTSSEAE
jgi:small subunit ribosomal protein S16